MLSTKKVVVIGGRYAGVAAAMRLNAGLGHQENVDLTLITKEDYFQHNLGSFRALVEPSFAEKLFIPYSKIFTSSNGKIVQGTVVAIHPNHVVLAGGSNVPFDYLVIATGSSYPSPSKSSKDARTESIAELQEIATAIKEAKSVLIVGGGPVGIEIAGEVATDYPEKKVTLVHASTTLMNGPYSDKFKARLLSTLQQRKVNVVLGEKVEGLKALFPDPTQKGWHVGETFVKTNKGREINADVILLATGNSLFNSHLVQSLSEDLIDAKGQLKVRPTLQLDNDAFPHIFAAGDVTNADMKLAYLAKPQAELAADNILKLIKSGPDAKLAAYKPSTSVLAVVSIGRNGGVAQLLGVWGDWVVKMLKSKDLFVKRYWADLGLAKEFPQ
ncbi:uncharacterized protein SPPG_04911 [Spizellomyces punctatus DAOM BR117]|uniref:FAD/NAD(P)-binding domain-containing protein n=1 Tax=Spizellomyces punctatus (strain DAOM BR117) TaxID=645134 RepID=A0A0L0HDG6_SPIPD|nr:uncharacterized protein SPPG_04911 [Spizellomyces punctatus DAOM BR117]KNC99520.1 hypothetical protein SPPG_04911 [Spizellomyces punctatus DAOM BR117]|eukprot:XP_016607560.1 hypothetical protein SPPG_04911 [Spizellomyces punctatus DAOM BR117]